MNGDYKLFAALVKGDFVEVTYATGGMTHTVKMAERRKTESKEMVFDGEVINVDKMAHTFTVKKTQGAKVEEMTFHVKPESRIYIGGERLEFVQQLQKGDAVTVHCEHEASGDLVKAVGTQKPTTQGERVSSRQAPLSHDNGGLVAKRDISNSKKEGQKTMQATRFRNFWLATVAAMVLIAGCQRAPVDGVNAATSALEAEKSAGAETYVKEAYAKAEEVLDEAKAEIEAQNGRSMFSRSYTEAASLLTRPKESADEAKMLAEKKHEEWKREAETLISDAQLGLASAREFAEKTSAAKRQELTGSLEKAGAELLAAEKAFEGRLYVEAHAKAEEAKALVDEVMEFGATPGKKKS